jgi:(p)ppGpp synthase/HD superfamily hydrolase
MPPGTPYVLCYDPTVLTSLKHAMTRSYNHGVAKCGESLMPLRHYRQAQSGEITCDDCLVVVAREIAELAHASRIDMDGRPHIEGIRRFVASAGQGVSANEVATRWLYDVLDDSNITPQALRENFIPAAVVAAVSDRRRVQATTDAGTGRARSAAAGRDRGGAT